MGGSLIQPFRVQEEGLMDCKLLLYRDKPLSSPTHRGLGEPLPHQQANGTHAYPIPNFFPHHLMPSCEHTQY